MTEPGPQTVGGTVLWHFSMSLDGHVTGPIRLHRQATPDPMSAVLVRYRPAG